MLKKVREKVSNKIREKVSFLFKIFTNDHIRVTNLNNEMSVRQRMIIKINVVSE